MKNLFPAGKPVGGNMLIGRKNLMDELYSILAIGQSVILVAPRRYGKTSVALEILERFKKEGYFIADVDLFEVTNGRHLAEKFIESCLKNNPVPLERYWKKLKSGALNVLSMLKFKPSNEDMEVVLQLGQPSVSEASLLDSAFDFPEKFATRHKKKLIMFLDEFQDAVKIGGDSLLKNMRAKFQRHKNVIYIFAGSQESLMTALFQSRQHAFYKFGRFFEIGNIPKEDFTGYISKTFTGEKIQIDNTIINTLLELTNGHPYYTQLLCQIVYIDCIRQKKNVVKKQDIDAAAFAVIEHEQSFFDEIWNELGDKKFSRKIVGLISQGASPYLCIDTTKENISRILSDLVRYGYVSKSGKGKNIQYTLKDPFFRNYVLAKMETLFL